MLKIPNHVGSLPSPMNAAITLGAVKILLAKITGITPALLILIGKKEAFAIEAVWPPPFPECCTGIFLFANSTNVTNAIMSK